MSFSIIFLILFSTILIGFFLKYKSSSYSDKYLQPFEKLLNQNEIINSSSPNKVYKNIATNKIFQKSSNVSKNNFKTNIFSSENKVNKLPWDQLLYQQCPKYGNLDDIDWNSVVFNATPTIIIY